MADDEVARLAFGEPCDPGHTITSMALSTTEHPLRWLSGWPAWVALAAVLAMIVGVRESRARTR